jgi:hypothetical protein
VEILRDATAIEVGLDPDRNVEWIRRIVLVLHCEIFGKDILDAGGELTTERNAPVTAVHRAVANDVVLRGAELGVVVFAGLDRDASHRRC